MVPQFLDRSVWLCSAIAIIHVDAFKSKLGQHGNLGLAFCGFTASRAYSRQIQDFQCTNVARVV